MYLYINSQAVESFLTNDGPKAVYKGKKGVALTFNLAWGELNAENILEKLKKENVKNATFFISGSWAERHIHIVEKIMKAGYDIGLLGYEYKDYVELEDVKIRQDILKAEEVFKKLGIKHKKFLRAPTGHFDQRLLTIANHLGYTVVHWSINSHDWKNPGVKQIINEVKKAENGDIILLHASDSAKQTAVALPNIIKELQTKNLKLVTITEILMDGKADTKEIQ